MLGLIGFCFVIGLVGLAFFLVGDAWHGYRSAQDAEEYANWAAAKREAHMKEIMAMYQRPPRARTSTTTKAQLLARIKD